MPHKEHESKADKNIKSDVEKYGWTVALFEKSTATPSFAYTIGLWKTFNHPEIVVFGLPINILYTILNDAGELVKGGKGLLLNVDNNDILINLPVQLRRVDASNIPDYFGFAQWFNEYEPFPALQLFWPDKAGKFPWEPTYDEKYRLDQPLLDRKLDFKFFEPQNAATFVAECVIKEGKPILWVWHDSDDGTWSFANKSSDNMLIVGLNEVVARDLTVNSLFNLEVDQIATRKYVGDKWKRKNAFPF
jgi:hypothetical protein